MKSSIWPLAVALVVLVAGAVAVVYYRSADEAAEVPPPDAAAEPIEIPAERVPEETPPARAAIPEPLPQEPPPEPLPELDESDEEVAHWLAEVVGAQPVEQYLVPDDIVRHLVVTIDNLARDHVTERQLPVRPTPGQFVATGSDDELEDDEPMLLSPDNYARYEPMVRAVQAIDASELVASYRRLYPLFREAYEDLGHASGDFNLRLLEVIDHLLETPEVEGPVELVRPNVLYEFEDERLEALSPGQKLLIRMGSENAAVVKEKLREIRDELI